MTSILTPKAAANRAAPTKAERLKLAEDWAYDLAGRAKPTVKVTHAKFEVSFGIDGNLLSKTAVASALAAWAVGPEQLLERITELLDAQPEPALVMSADAKAKRTRELKADIEYQQRLEEAVNLHKKDECIRVLEAALPVAAHLDDLQLILGERVRQKLQVDLWQAVRESGNLKIAVSSGTREFSGTYANVAGYRLVDPARKKLVPTIETALRGFRAIPAAANVIAAGDAERNDAAKKFARSLQIAREVLYDVEDLRKFVSITTTATIRNWSMQPNAAAQVYMRREGLSVLVGRSEDSASSVILKDVIDHAIPPLPVITVTAQ